MTSANVVLRILSRITTTIALLTPAKVWIRLSATYGLNPGSKVLEIGCGTGQFTRLLTETGCSIDALDLSAEMIAFARNKFKESSTRFYESTFEDFDALDGIYDFIVSATAFHWVAPDARAHKTARLLRPGGTLCFLYNYNDYRETTDPVRTAIQEVYKKVLSSAPKKAQLLEDMVGDVVEGLQTSPHYTEARRFALANPMTYTTEDYLGNMATHSIYNLLPTEQKHALSNGVREIIITHGGHVTIPYETVMHCFRKAT